MKKMVVLYLTGDTRRGSGFLMERTRMHGQETTVPLAVEVPTDGNPDAVAMEYVSQNLALTPAQITSEAMGARRQDVTDAKTGQSETCEAYRYSMGVVAGSEPKLEWADQSGFVHHCEWSNNRPY